MDSDSYCSDFSEHYGKLYPMDDFLGIMVSEDEIKDIINRIASAINADYKGKKLLLCGVLKGASIFFADLTRKIHIPHEITFIKASSYGGNSVSDGNVRVTEIDKLKNYVGYSVIIVDDIYDTGNTAYFLENYFINLGFKDINFCVFVEKPERNEKNMNVKYVGKKIADEFAVGYGLDYNEKYRYLPFLAALKREVYENTDNK